MHALAVIAASVVFVFEFQNLLSWWGGRTLRLSEETTEDYKILVPLFGHPRFFTARESLEPLKFQVVVVCEISSELMATYADELEEDGFEVCRATMVNPNPARLVKHGLGSVETTYALRLDADTLIDDRISNAVSAVARSGAELASVRIEVASPRGLTGGLQALEYRMAMLARRYRPWLTSGACFIGRTDSLREVFNSHSTWSPGEDIETGRVALALRKRIRHVDYVAYTDVPQGWRALARQRVLWWAGNWRHFVMNFDHNILQLPALTVYYVTGAWMAIYFHVWTVISFDAYLHYLPLILGGYLLLIVVCNTQILSPWMVLFPFYSLLQTTMMPPLGALKYMQLAHQRKELGRYRFGWRRSPKAAMNANESQEETPEPDVAP